MLDALFEDYRGASFGVRLWDEWSWDTAADGCPKCVLIFHSHSSLKTLLAHPSELTLGEAFLAGQIDVEGDLFAVFEVVEYVFRRPQGRRRRFAEALTRSAFVAIDWLNKGPVHSVKRDRAAISHHYDQPVEFFRLWLGDCLVYSCAYFQSPGDGLAAAQANKLELICRKLGLRHDDRFLDIGCGWGSLILHAASRHNVYAQGTTISHEQAAVATARIEAARMTQSCRVDLLDYRLAPGHFAPFDKIGSVGMFEHVGTAHLSEYFRIVHSMLKPGGVFLNHGIARAPIGRNESKSRLAGLIERVLERLPMLRRTQRSSFIDRYVFPDGELCTLSEALTAAEEAGFEVRDVENLREHYELTLRAWVKNLERSKQQIVEQFSERTYRIWLLYMAGSAASFHRGDIAVYQTLMCRPDAGESRLPLTRHDWYQEQPI
jgi:cyclopropane-fatty-acyl-phospholipid synthase